VARAETFADLAGFARHGRFRDLNRPRVASLTAPRSMTMGEEFVLAWRTESAQRVTISLEGVIELVREVPAVGRWTLQPQTPGPLHIQLRCFGQADAAGNVSLCVDHIEVDVQAPPVRLRLRRHELSALPGQWVRLHWSADGAAQVLLIRPLRGEELEAPAHGAVDLTMDAIEDSVQVVAIGHDGERRVTETCRLYPKLALNPDVSLELDTLTQPLEELSHGLK